MEDPQKASDSEDDAFESADEGDTDNVPDPVGRCDDEDKDEGNDTNSKEKLEVRSSQEKSHAKEELDENSKEHLIEESNESLEEGKEETKKEESGDRVGANDTLIAELREENNKEYSEEMPDNEYSTAAKEEESGKGNNLGSEMNNLASEVNTLNVGNEPTEPVAEKIHESSTDEVNQQPLMQAIDRLAEASSSNSTSHVPESSLSSGWGWGTWGNMLSKATSSVSSMLETVETQLGIPNPTEMAKLATSSKSNQDNDLSKPEDSSDLKPPTSEAETEVGETKPENEPVAAGLGSWLSGIGMSNLSSMVQNTGKEIVSGGLDALEFVGKKTIDAISHGDPGFRRKRITLSQAIREAKERAEQSGNQETDDQFKLNTFSIEFDKFQGLAHLEALEMISRESEQELEKLLEARAEESRTNSDELLAALKSIFHVSEEDDDDGEDEGLESDNDFDDVISDHVANLSLSVAPVKLISAYHSSRCESEQQDNEARSTEELYSIAISCFAELTARSVELFHKIGEFMLLPDVKASSLAKTRGNALVKICMVLRASITGLSSRFAKNLNEKNPKSDDSVSKMITDIYLEASNSSSYITDSFRLLSPIVQLSSLKDPHLAP